MKSPFLAKLEEYIQAHPYTPGFAKTHFQRREIPTEWVPPETPSNIQEIPILQVLKTVHPIHRVGSSYSEAQRVIQIAYADIIGTVTESRRGENAKIFAAALVDFRATVSGLSDSKTSEHRRHLGDAYHDSLNLLKHSPAAFRLDSDYQTIIKPWSGGVRPASLKEFQLAVAQAAAMRLNLPMEDVVTVGQANVSLLLGLKRYAVNLETLTVEEIPYPQPQAGQRWTDDEGNEYVVVGESSVAHLKTGTLIPLNDDFTLPGKVRGETFNLLSSP